MTAKMNPATIRPNGLTLHIETDSAAFDDAPASEIARILRAYAAGLECGEVDPDQSHCILNDINGETVGSAQITAAKASVQ